MDNGMGKSAMDLIAETARAVKAVNPEWYGIAQARIDNLTKPVGSLGRLEEFARLLVAITENRRPTLDKKVIFAFAGDHGVVDEGVSAYPKEVTPQMVFNFLAGGAAINVLAGHAGAEVVVVDTGVNYDFGFLDGLIDRKVRMGTGNMAKGPAMTKDEAVKCVEVGIKLAFAFREKGYKLFGTGDMGIGNTTPSSAIAAVITGAPVADVTGKGTGISDEMLTAKIKVIQDAMCLNEPDPRDGIDVLAKVGGTEIGAIAGLILGAASRRTPVVIDGFISTAGALIAHTIQPLVRDYLFAAHNSVEKGHKIILETMSLAPILDLGLRLGEGTGAALAMMIIEGSLKIYNEMATFEEAGVSEKTPQC
jgi:nicotinate-nucleotide--dimethylbenzimidazole phosphoribosyltransferase